MLATQQLLGQHLQDTGKGRRASSGRHCHQGCCVLPPATALKLNTKRPAYSRWPGGRAYGRGRPPPRSAARNIQHVRFTAATRTCRRPSDILLHTTAEFLRCTILLPQPGIGAGRLASPCFKLHVVLASPNFPTKQSSQNT
jgi:hypothetical protein